MPDAKPLLTEKNLYRAKDILFAVTQLLDRENIPYHLEGGTLLGIVRDKNLLPWDNDTDISIPFEYATALTKLKLKLLLRGYKLSTRKSKVNVGPIKEGQYSLFKVKPLFHYLLSAIVPSNKDNLIVLDIFVKTKDGTHTYWQAKEKTMRVENKYYTSFETVDLDGNPLKAPNHYPDYLTEKYGNWSIPVREWDCGVNELTILKN